jgi:hypothetical protein
VLQEINRIVPTYYSFRVTEPMDMASLHLFLFLHGINPVGETKELYIRLRCYKHPPKVFELPPEILVA